MMEKRLILAIVLSFLVLVLYQALFVKKPPYQDVEGEILPETAARSVEVPPEKELPVAAEPSPLEPEETGRDRLFDKVSAGGEEQIFINTPLYQAVWSNRGGTLKSWRLKEHQDDRDEDMELVSPLAREFDAHPFLLSTDDPEFDDRVNGALYRVSSLNLDLKHGQKGEIWFEYADEQGTRVEKSFVFEGGSYDFNMEINAWKKGQKIEPRILWGPGLGNPAVAEQKQRFGGGPGIAVFAGQKVYRTEERKYKPGQNAFNFVNWAAYEDNYFTALFITPPQRGSAVFERAARDDIQAFFLSVSLPQRAYLGPKEYDRLRDFGHEAKRLVNFGFFGGIAEILLMAIKFIHEYIPNWGFSIMILTMFIKIIFFPLTYSSSKSMARMQELQPKIKAIRAKYKKAKRDIAQRRQMNEEMMRLYKEHKINPAGGCLPMLVQIPVFWGFFRLLVVAIEFRHSPFILWIKDLSVKDPFYVTPILMGVTQFISQKMTPTSADPAQARMMLLMPVIMTFFFMNFQSGLVLYWLTSNVLQIGQQYIMNRMMSKKKRESHGKRRKK